MDDTKIKILAALAEMEQEYNELGKNRDFFEESPTIEEVVEKILEKEDSQENSQDESRVNEPSPLEKVLGMRLK